jgi:peptide chain release factor 2
VIFDDLAELLKSCEPDIEIIKKHWDKNNFDTRFKELEEISQQENFWQHPKQIAISKELQHLRSNKEAYDEITNSYTDNLEIIELLNNNEAELKKLEPEIKQLSWQVKSFKVNMLLGEPEDKANCFISINSGAGGTESQDWAEMILRMYLRFCEQNNLKADVLDYQGGDEAGIKSATVYIKGKQAHGLLKSEHGIHRLVRISPFDSNKRRHTSFAAVYVVPESTDDTAIIIDPKDLRIDTYRASGAGGQHVNKTDSAVRITHIPTNIVVQCQNERSQLQNRETAMKMLKAKLAQRQKEEKEKELSKIEKKKIEWGSQIRSYVLHPYKMVKDHRTNIESPQPELVLDGNLINFIEAYLVQN